MSSFLGPLYDLASYFTEEKLPGVGISIGATRLVVRLIEAGILKPGPATAAPVLVTTIDENKTGDYLRIGATLRGAGIPTEVFFEKARLGEQLRYANKKGFNVAIIAGDSEFSQNSVKIKNLITGDETLTPLSDLAQKVKEALGYI